MKTAIITFNDAENYGAVLQAFALRKKCSEYCDTSLLNYYNPFFHKNGDCFKSVKSVFKYVMSMRNRIEKKKKFSGFQNKYLTYNNPRLLASDMKQIGTKYDCFITGSDQVWNMQCSGNDKSYFLDFTNHNKNSYAASLGHVDETDSKQIKELLEDFDNISVREKKSSEYISELLNIDVPVVLDPCFLLTKTEWEKEFNLNFKQDYVLVYEVLVGSKLFNDAKAFAKSKGLKILCVTSSDKIRYGAKFIKDAGPVDWLKLLAGAAYIFTNSFHGIVFSIIFNKQFYVELLPPPANTNLRITELLSLFKQEERIYEKCTTDNNIDYDFVNRVIIEERKKSINYLEKILVQ